MNWLCHKLPTWITPNLLTLLGASGAATAFFGYWLSGVDKTWLWLAVLGLFTNWLGDSLDGSIARYRGTERHRFGFFLDHMTDTLAIGLIALGLGFSPFARFDVALVLLVAYYGAMILSLVTLVTTGTFRISSHGAGPTEIRLLLIVATVGGIMLPTPTFAFGPVTLTIYDIGMLVLATIMVQACVVEALRTSRALALTDPKQR